jgi:hypothetical protein
MAALDPAIHVLPRRSTNVDARDKPGHDDLYRKLCSDLARAYALAMSGKTASILVFSVAALNGLTM